jgi:hypothetical protein
MRPRRVLLAVHRDLGYLFAVLTVIYAISGIAVNHVEHWNPNYSITVRTHDMAGLPDGAAEVVGAEVLERLAIEDTPKSVIPLGPGRVKIFLEGRTLTVLRAEDRVVDEQAAERTGLFEANYLHLNHGKGFWTWFADLYALALIFLAVSGVLIIPGRNGIRGRGAWFMAAGTLIPLVFLILSL